MIGLNIPSLSPATETTGIEAGIATVPAVGFDALLVALLGGTEPSLPAANLENPQPAAGAPASLEGDGTETPYESTTKVSSAILGLAAGGVDGGKEAPRPVVAETGEPRPTQVPAATTGPTAPLMEALLRPPRAGQTSPATPSPTPESDPPNPAQTATQEAVVGSTPGREPGQALAAHPAAVGAAARPNEAVAATAAAKAKVPIPNPPAPPGSPNPDSTAVSPPEDVAQWTSGVQGESGRLAVPTAGLRPPTPTPMTRAGSAAVGGNLRKVPTETPVEPKSAAGAEPPPTGDDPAPVMSTPVEPAGPAPTPAIEPVLTGLPGVESPGGDLGESSGTADGTRDPSPANIRGQVLGQLLSRNLSNGGGQRLVLKLQPEALGKVAVELRPRGQRLEIVFRAESPEAERALADGADDLVQALIGRGEGRWQHVDVRVERHDGQRPQDDRGREKDPQDSQPEDQGERRQNRQEKRRENGAGA